MLKFNKTLNQKLVRSKEQYGNVTVLRLLYNLHCWQSPSCHPFGVTEVEHTADCSYCEIDI